MIESSFVIPAWFLKGQKGLEHDDEILWWAHECMKRILEVTPRDKFELIIVDNGSDNFSTIDDDGEEISTEDYFDYADVLVRHEKNLGYGPGMGAGIAVARGKYIFCLEDDIFPFPGWYEELIKTFSVEGLKKPVGLVHPWSIGCRGKRRARDTITYDDPNLVWTGRTIYHPGKEWGGVHVTLKSDFEKLKKKDGYYFDPQFGLGYSEDKDLYKRIRHVLDKETYRCYNSVVFHSTGTSYGHLAGSKERMAKNKILLKEKWDKII